MKITLKINDVDFIHECEKQSNKEVVNDFIQNPKKYINTKESEVSAKVELPVTEQNWAFLLEGYNRIYKRKFKTAEEMVQYLYGEYQTLQGVADVLGTHKISVLKFMKAKDLPRLPKGHRGDSPLTQAFKKLKNGKDMKIKDIAKALECSIGYASVLRKNLG